MKDLERIAKKIRRSIIDVVYHSGSGHLGGSLSQTDILVALYYRTMKIDPADDTRDRFVMSKGHGGLGLAAILADKGFVSDLSTFGETGAALGMHMDHRRVPGIETSTGSLGHGLGTALGMSLGLRLRKSPARTFCLLSDGECYEGSTWEAALGANALRAENLFVFIDRNRMTMDGDTEKEAPLEPLCDKWRAFGWRTFTCDGHDMTALCSAIDGMLAEKTPAVLIAETIKGKGVDFMEGQPKWHYGALDSEMYARARRCLGE